MEVRYGPYANDSMTLCHEAHFNEQLGLTARRLSCICIQMRLCTATERDEGRRAMMEWMTVGMYFRVLDFSSETEGNKFAKAALAGVGRGRKRVGKDDDNVDNERPEV